MAGLAVLSLPSTSHQPKYSLHPCSSPSLNSFSTSSIKLPSKPLSASSPSSSTSVAQADSSPSSDSVPIPSEPPSADLSFSGGCKACGREEVQRGCNGEGRIQGGIATVPGFGWWPIKAYRPCPGFIASGGRYRRSGQSMDEVAFGRTERATAGLGAIDQPQSRDKLANNLSHFNTCSKEKQRPRKSKR